MLSLDRAAVCRLGAPTLGVPILELGFRGAGPDPAPEAAEGISGPLADAVIVSLYMEIARLDRQHDALAARLAVLETPWWLRLWMRLRSWLRIDG